MSVVAWIVLGLISGFIASNVVRSTGQGLLLDIVLGIIGAVVGGFLYRPSTRQGSLVEIHTAWWFHHWRGCSALALPAQFEPL